MRLDYTFDRQIELEKRDSFEEGLSIGQVRHLTSLIIAKVKRGKSTTQISDELETDISTIEPIYNIIIEYAPDYNIDKILDRVMNEHISVL